MMNKSVWNNQVPVEKSSYINESTITYFNVDRFAPSPDSDYMLDLFCGAGGFSIGCSWAGFETVFGIDFFRPAMDTWIFNHPNAIGCLGDIRKVDPIYIKNLLAQKGVDHITLLTGGVPCQGFTIANRKHNDFDERNYLYLEYMRFVKAFWPDYIILENVSGMRSTANGHFEKQILQQMKELGYDSNVKMLNALDYGVPQQRQRLVFVGVRSDLNRNPYRYPTSGFNRGIPLTVEDAFSDLPELEAGQTKTEYKSRPNNDYQRLLRGEGFIKAIVPPSELNNHSAPNHPESTQKLISRAKQGEPMYPSFKQRIRLSLNNPSPTQLAGGIRPSFQFGHPTEARGLTTRERARIQSFPDNYVFKGGIVQERIQTGNAIPPIMAYYLAKNIRENISDGNKST